MLAVILITVLVTVLVTAFLIILILNLRAGEKQIQFQLTHRFAVDDPQFVRCMGPLLGPGLLSGNQITALQNGEQILPAMLKAIRGAQQTITFETNKRRALVEANRALRRLIVDLS